MNKITRRKVQQFFPNLGQKELKSQGDKFSIFIKFRQKGEKNKRGQFSNFIKFRPKREKITKGKFSILSNQS